MVLLSVKLKNEIAKKAKGKNLVYHLKNISINGNKRGCSGFICNQDNNSIVYVNTEIPSMNLGYMYRYADSVKDYIGYHNRWAKTSEELVSGILKCLEKTPEEARDHRISGKFV